MLATRSLLFCLSFSLLLVGCASTEPPTLEQLEHEDSTLSFELSDLAPELPEAEEAVGPTLNYIRVSPQDLPVGGGEVDIKWESQGAVFCTLRRAGEDDIKLGSEGRFEIDIQETTVIGFFCTDGLQLQGLAEQRYVRVQPLPTEKLGPAIKEVTLGAHEEKTITSAVDSTALQFVEVTLKTNSWLRARAVSKGLRSDLSIWLVHDSNDDGFLEASEVIDYQLVGPEVDAQDRLRAGSYTVIVVPRSPTGSFSLTLQSKPI